LFGRGARYSGNLRSPSFPFTNDAFGKVEGNTDFLRTSRSTRGPKLQGAKEGAGKRVPKGNWPRLARHREYKDAYDWMAAELAKYPKTGQVRPALPLGSGNIGPTGAALRFAGPG